MNNAKFRKEQEVEKFEIREDFYLDGKKIKIISVWYLNIGGTDWKN